MTSINSVGILAHAQGDDNPLLAQVIPPCNMQHCPKQQVSAGSAHVVHGGVFMLFAGNDMLMAMPERCMLLEWYADVVVRWQCR